MAKKSAKPKFFPVDPDDLKPMHKWHRPLQAPGITQVDFEERIDFQRLHRYRLARTRQSLAASGLAFRVESEARLIIGGFTGFLLWRDLDEHWSSFVRRPLVRQLLDGRLSEVPEIAQLGPGELDGPAAAAAGSPADASSRTSACRSATVRAPANAASSIVVWKVSSSATISSTRSSELSPSSSIVEEASTARPWVYRVRTASTESAGAAAAAAVLPVARLSRMRARFSFRVPSVRGSASPLHTDTPRIF